MNSSPYTHQLVAARQLHRFGGRMLLADEVGLGKSLAALLYAHQRALFPMLIVCPKSLKWNWAKEAKLHFNTDSLVLDRSRPYLDVSEGKKTPITIINYDVVISQRGKGQGWMRWLLNVGYEYLIIDEGHYLASQSSKRTKACSELCSEIPKVCILTGTPFTSEPAQIWPMLNMLRADIWPSWKNFAWEHCLPADAPILMEDLTEKPISEIQIGDKVIGWSKGNIRKHRSLTATTVVDVIVRHDCLLQKVTLMDGTEVICTPDHKWATGGTGAEGNRAEYSIARTAVKSGIGRWSASRIMKVMRGTSPHYPETPDYMRGYIAGFFRGDGHCVKKTKTHYHPFKLTNRRYTSKYNIGCACKDPEPIDRLSEYLTALGKEHSQYVRSDGLHAIGACNRADFYTFLTIECGEKDSDEWWAGFLGGIYDAEGSDRGIAQKRTSNAANCAMIEKGLKRFQFDFSCYGKIKARYYIKGGKLEFMRFWCVANPSLRRKLIAAIMAVGGKMAGNGGTSYGGEKTVAKIEPIPGLHTTFTLTTETGNYVAYGCGSKNCDPKRSRFHGGWEFKGAVNMDRLHQKLEQNVMLRRTKAEVLSELPARTRCVLPLPIANEKEYRKAETDFIAWMRENMDAGRVRSAMRAEALVKVNYLKQLAAKLKMPAVINWIEDFLMSGKKLVVFCTHRRVVADLRSRWRSISVEMQGDTPARERQNAVNRFQNEKQCRLFIGNLKAAGVGITLTAASDVAFVEYGWTPGEHFQAGGRCDRVGQTEPVTEWWLIANQTVESKIVELLQKKQQAFTDAIDGGVTEDNLNVFDQLCEVMN